MGSKCKLVRFYVACGQALQLGDIVKSRRARGTREETRMRGAEERKESLQRSLIDFHFHPGNFNPFIWAKYK